MFRSGKYRHFQDRRNWPEEKLKELYKQSGTDIGMKVAITRELNARAGKTPLHSPQAKRQRIVQWAMLNAKNTAGMLRHNRYKLAAISRELGDGDKAKALDLSWHMLDAAKSLELLIKQSQDLYPPKAKKKEKENA